MRSASEASRQFACGAPLRSFAASVG